jgi:hypothetical protein
MNGEVAASTAAATEGDPCESLTVQIPHASAVAIHFPGFINPDSPAAALNTFGGEAGLSTALGEQVGAVLVGSLLLLHQQPTRTLLHTADSTQQQQQQHVTYTHSPQVADPTPTAAPAARGPHHLVPCCESSPNSLLSSSYGCGQKNLTATPCLVNATTN